MRLKFNKAASGSENGYQVNSYLEGEVYDVNDESLSKHFIDAGFAEEVSSDATKRIVEGSAETLSRGSLAPSALAKIKADEKNGLARPETDRLVEVSESNQVDVAEEKAKKRNDRRRESVAVEGEDEVENKALNNVDYENKSGNKKGR